MPYSYKDLINRFMIITHVMDWHTNKTWHIFQDFFPSFSFAGVLVCSPWGHNKTCLVFVVGQCMHQYHQSIPKKEEICVKNVLRFIQHHASLRYMINTWPSNPIFPGVLYFSQPFLKSMVTDTYLLPHPTLWLKHRIYHPTSNDHGVCAHF